MPQILWTKSPSKLADVEVVEQLLTRKKIWRLRYNYRGNLIICKWRMDAPPNNQKELDEKLKLKPHYFDGD